MHGMIPSPVRATPMPSRRAFDVDEFQAINDVVRYYFELDADPGYQGEFEQRYTDAFVAQMGGGYADAVATGTAALYVAVAALDLPKGSEVIVSPITDPGTLSAIVLNGLKPRLADSMPGSFNMGSNEAMDRITPNVSAIMVVHSIGRPAPIEGILIGAQTMGIRVIEDCSQSHGATIKGRQVGTFGDIAAFSTMYRKAHATGGSGGVVYTRDLELHHKALAHADRGKPRWLEGFDDRDPSSFLFPALNLHTDEISCGIGIASLARLPDTINKRLMFVADLTSRMRDRCKLCRPYGYTPGDSPFLYPVVAALRTRDKIAFAKKVQAEGIPLSPHYRYLAADWPWLKPYLADDFDTPNARSIRDHSFCLYLNENYEATEAADIVNAIVKVERRFGF